MQLSRRQVLTAAATATAVGALSGCQSIEQLTNPVHVGRDTKVIAPRLSFEDAGMLLGRAGFGHRPGDRSTLQEIGLNAFIDRQLSPDQITEDEVLLARARALIDQIPDDFGLLFEQDDHVLINSLCQTSLLHAVYSKRGLFERVVEFWSDHFNVSAFKCARLPQYLVMFNLNVIRPNALGSFRDLLRATAQSAAILTYLDNDVNRAGRPNENYARELLELHTMGIDGGYEQCDVEQVARCLTGWTVDNRFRPGDFHFEEKWHDFGAKRVFGRRIVGSGRQEMESIIDELATSPSTARHVSRQLLKRFRGDASPCHVNHLSNVFLESDGDIKQTLRALFLDCEILSSPPILKRPFDFIVSALRAVDADTDCVDSVSYLTRMGQPLYQWPRPDGFPDSSEEWATCMSSRWQFALDLAASFVPNTSINWQELIPSGSVDEVVGRIFSKRPSREERFALDAAGARSIAEATALALMSPSFHWR